MLARVRFANIALPIGAEGPEGSLRGRGLTWRCLEATFLRVSSLT